MWTFIAVVAGILAGPFAGVVVQAMTDRSHPLRNKRAVLAGFAVSVLVFAVVQVFAQNLSQPSRADRRDAGTPSGPPSTSTTSSDAPVSTAPTTRSAEPERPTVMATSLLDLPAVEVDTNRSIDLEPASPIDIDGVSYGRALVYSCSLYCDGSSPQVREVTLGRRYTRFNATAAVLDTSSGRHRIDITLDGKSPRTFITEPGKSVKISLDVSRVSRMRIELYAPGELKNPLQAGADAAVGENGGGLPGVGLADPVLQP
jgi:hypothetical protein